MADQKIVVKKVGKGRFFLGLFVGIILTFILICCGLYYIYKNVTFSTIEEKFNVSVDTASNTKIKNMTLNDLVNTGIDISNNSNLYTIKDIVGKFGYSLPVSFEVEGKTLNLEEALNKLYSSKLSNYEDGITNFKATFTFNYVKQVLTPLADIPNFNFFKNYGNVNIQNAGNIYNTLIVDDFYVPEYDAEGNLVEYTGIQKALKNTYIKDLMSDGGVNNTINNLKIGDIVVNDGTGIIGSLSNLTVGELNNDSVVNALGNKTMGEILNITDTTGVLGKLKDVTINNLKNEQELLNQIGDVKVSDLVDTTSATGVLKAIKDLTINDLSTNTGIMNAINTMTLKDLLNISDSETGILGSLKGLTIQDLQDNTKIANAVNTLKLTDFISITDTTGILSVIKDLTINDLSNSDTIINNISTLKISDILPSDTDYTSSMILNAIKDSQLSNIDTTIANLTLSQVIAPNGTGNTYTGFLGELIDTANNKDPKLTELSTAIDTAFNSFINKMTIGDLINRGIIADKEGGGYSAEVKAKTVIEVINSALASY